MIYVHIIEKFALYLGLKFLNCIMIEFNFSIYLHVLWCLKILVSNNAIKVVNYLNFNRLSRTLTSFND